MNEYFISLIYCIGSIISSIALIIVFIFYRGANQTTLYDSIISQICIADLINSLSYIIYQLVFYGLLQDNYKEKFPLTIFILEQIIEPLSYYYSLIMALLIAYITWKEIQNIFSFDIKKEYLKLIYITIALDLTITIPEATIRIIAKFNDDYQNVFIIRMISISLILLMTLYYYTRIIMIFYQKGISLSPLVLKLYIYPIIIIITQIPVIYHFKYIQQQSLIQTYYYNNNNNKNSILVIILINYSNLLGLMDAIAYGKNLSQNMIHETTINEADLAEISTGSSKNKSLPNTNNQENHSLD